jgi:hypothetical protein
MLTKATLNAFPDEQPEFDTIYGDFSKGTARKVFMPRISHIQESHCQVCIAEALEWMKSALDPPEELWKDPADQLWPVKESMTLLAMLACFICTMPIALLLLKTGFFSSIRGPVLNFEELKK